MDIRVQLFRNMFMRTDEEIVINPKFKAIFSRVHATLKLAMSVGRSVRRQTPGSQYLLSHSHSLTSQPLSSSLFLTPPLPPAPPPHYKKADKM